MNQVIVIIYLFILYNDNSDRPRNSVFCAKKDFGENSMSTSKSFSN